MTIRGSYLGGLSRPGDKTPLPLLEPGEPYEEIPPEDLITVGISGEGFTAVLYSGHIIPRTEWFPAALRPNKPDSYVSTVYNVVSLNSNGQNIANYIDLGAVTFNPFGGFGQLNRPDIPTYPNTLVPFRQRVYFDCKMEPLVGKFRPDGSVVESGDPVERILYPVRMGPASQIGIQVSNGSTFFTEIRYRNENLSLSADLTLESDELTGLTAGLLDSCTHTVQFASLGTWSVQQINDMLITAQLDNRLGGFDVGRLHKLAMTVVYEDFATETVRPDRVASFSGPPYSGGAGLSAAEVLADDSDATWIECTNFGPYENEEGGAPFFIGACYAMGVGFTPLSRGVDERVRSISFEFWAGCAPTLGINRRITTSLPLAKVITAPTGGLFPEVEHDFVPRMGPIVCGDQSDAGLYELGMAVPVGDAASEVILPTETISNTGWTVNGGATLHGVLADAVNASNASCSMAPDCTLAFGDLIDAGGRPIQSIDVLLRGHVGLYGGGLTVFPLSPGVTFSPASRAPAFIEAAQQDLTLNFTKDGGGTFTEGEVNSLTVRMQTAGFANAIVNRLRARANY